VDRRAFDVVTFDCYGTLIDWEAGITRAFQEAAAADGLTLDPAAVMQALGLSHHLGVQGKRANRSPTMPRPSVSNPSNPQWHHSPPGQNNVRRASLAAHTLYSTEQAAN
jgi:phosphoglycolate phosphatase-like HAD superfamily hydrolase